MTDGGGWMARVGRFAKGGGPPVARLFKRMQKGVALSPGTVVFHGPKRVERVQISAMEYGPDYFRERRDVTVEEALTRGGKNTVLWVDVDGLHETSILEDIGSRFGLHPLALEDVAHANQRPKADDFEDYLLIVLRMIRHDETSNSIVSEQVSLVLGPDYVFSFQEAAGDVFDPVRERIRQGKGRSRGLGADYLADILMDSIVDNYYVVLDKIGERIEALEEPVVSDPSPEILREIHGLKHDLVYMRKYVTPLRELIGGLARGESKLVAEETTLFLRDVYDHTIHVVESVEAFRDMLSGLQDLYLSSVSNRMNQVMKVLTIVGTIFVPLTFLAGVYGMNFEYMPELGWRWSYPIFWLVAAGIGAGMIGFFWRSRWF